MQSLGLPMRHIPILALLFFCDAAVAMGFGGALGSNRLGQKIHIEESKSGVSIFVESPGQVEWAEFPILDECPNWNWDGQRSFSCKFTGRSPLAGATYNVGISGRIRSACGKRAVVYTCVRGCNKKAVPATFVVQPWEC